MDQNSVEAKHLAGDIDGITIKDEFSNNNDSSKNSFFFLKKIINLIIPQY